MQVNGLAHERVADLVAGIGVFGFGILEKVAGKKTAIDGDVDVFGDGGGDDEAAAVFAVVRGQIVPPPPMEYAGVCES